MFKFLKLRNSVLGDARRHVPFTSIIHKPFFVIIALVFSFIAVVPVKVQAAAPQLKPQFNPILDTDIVNFQDSYLNLDPAAQAAASLLFGAYITEYAGLGDYGYVFDEVPSEASFKERLIFMGDQLVDTIFLPVNMADQLILTPLINLGQGIINKVKGVTSVDDFYDDILDASDYGLSYTPDIGFALNQLFAKNGNLYNWQFSTAPFSSQVPYYSRYSQASSLVQSEYNLNKSYLSYPVVRFNHYNGSYDTDIVYSGNLFALYHNIFINTNSHSIRLVDDNGSYTSSRISNNWVDIRGDYVNNLFVGHGSSNLLLRGGSYNANNFSDVQSLVQYIYNQNVQLIDYSGYNPFFEDFVQHIYAGTDWNNKVEVFNDTDLGISQTDSLQVLNPIKDAVFDLKALIEQIVQAQPDPNYELPLQPIIYNITQVEGSPLTAEDLQGISFNVTPPESGIDVPINVFLPFFDDGKGFISYMWYMTKPLVSYTRSFLDAITFDPVDGFNASGPGYFILGVAALGLIGGVIVKFLL